MNAPRILAILAPVLLIAAAHGCASARRTSPTVPTAPTSVRKDFSEEMRTWEQLAVKRGCLCGSQDWRAGSPMEGCCLRTEPWQSFLNETPPEFALEMLELFDSKEKTAVHVCPFANATKGELAVYTVQHLLRVNWRDYDGNNAVITAAAKDQTNRQAALRRVLVDKEARAELRRFFAQRVN